MCAKHGARRAMYPARRRIRRAERAALPGTSNLLRTSLCVACRPQHPYAIGDLPLIHCRPPSGFSLGEDDTRPPKPHNDAVLQIGSIPLSCFLLMSPLVRVVRGADAANGRDPVALFCSWAEARTNGSTGTRWSGMCSACGGRDVLTPRVGLGAPDRGGLIGGATADFRGVGMCAVCGGGAAAPASAHGSGTSIPAF